MDTPTPPPIAPIPRVPASDQPSERQFYFHKNEQQMGPYTEQQVEEMLLAGSITATDLAWHEGLPNWQSLSTIIPAGNVPSPPPNNNAAGQNIILSVLLLLILVVAVLYFSFAGKTDLPKSSMPAPTPSLLTRSGHSPPSGTSTTPVIADDTTAQATPQMTVLPALPLNAPPPALPVPSPAPPLYSVVGISAGDTLNVHSAPASTSTVTAQLPNGYDKITIVGDAVMNATTAWVHITFAEGSGWVNRDFLTPQTPAIVNPSISPSPTAAQPAVPVTVAPATPTALPLSSPTQPTYAVAGLRAGDTINVHSAPASTSPVTARLPNGYGKITIVSDAVMNNTTEWVNITFAGGTGWVNKDFLNVETP